MLLAVDIGNTIIGIGLFEGQTLRHHWRIASRRDGTPDEYSVLVTNLFTSARIPIQRVTGMIQASVVPSLDATWTEVGQRLLGVLPLTVEPGIKTGMPVLYDNPREVGADRIVNAVAAYEAYGGPAIVVDFGTATTFDAISERGEYLGGAISPGVGISAEALFERAAKLPRVEFVRPRSVIGKNTVQSIQAGLFFGTMSLVDGMVRRISHELGGQPAVVGTGGFAHLILAESETVKHVDPLLTLTGLRIIFERNR
ncbi:MAG: type III pantothenate kinase [Candidatus Methylomirabilales bacterium]